MNKSGTVAAALLLGLAPMRAARADAPAPALHGLAPGQTMAAATEAAHLPCQQPAYSSELNCRDDADGSNYRATFSAGDPSIALTVQRSFCAHEDGQAVLDRVLTELKAGADRAHRDPNGYHIDLDGNNEAVLNADDGTCPDGAGKHFILLVRSNTLINTSADQAVDRAKAAMH